MAINTRELPKPEIHQLERHLDSRYWHGFWTGICVSVLVLVYVIALMMP